ncbi:cysteine dioxygenase [Aspergillus sp. HF37]|nr:cysteine dioxygenase [Aspergillus sp. HF37]
MSSQLLSPKPDLHWGPSECRLPATYSLEDLVGDIKAYLGTSSGLDSSDVDPDYLISLVQRYISEPADWLRFFNNDSSKNYTRNAIENINHKANILLLVWNPQKGSPVHDHANAHCIMKVLAGELRETVYHAPSGSQCAAGDPLQIKSATTHQPDAVSYISDDIGLHRVHNPSRNQLAVSLHLYTPPNAADYGYNVFDEGTGKSSFVSQAKSVPHAAGQ